VNFLANDSHSRYALFVFSLLLLWSCQSETQKSQKSTNKEIPPAVFPTWTPSFIRSHLGEPTRILKENEQERWIYPALTFVYEQGGGTLLALSYTRASFRLDLQEKGKLFLDLLPSQLNFSQSPKTVESLMGRRADHITQTTRLGQIVSYYEYRPVEGDWRYLHLQFARPALSKASVAERLQRISISLLPAGENTF
jgi:hypothetical protein